MNDAAYLEFQKQLIALSGAMVDMDLDIEGFLSRVSESETTLSAPWLIKQARPSAMKRLAEAAAPFQEEATRFWDEVRQGASDA